MYIHLWQAWLPRGATQKELPQRGARWLPARAAATTFRVKVAVVAISSSAEMTDSRNSSSSSSSSSGSLSQSV